jgi:hypothetical protein
VGELTCQPNGLIETHWKHSHEVKTLVLKWVIMKGQNPEHEVLEI